MIYSKITDLPETLQSALKSIGYSRVDIRLSAAEKVDPRVIGGKGMQGFCVIVNLETGAKDVKMGSWSGANIFNPNNAVDLDSNQYDIPFNVAVIKGSRGDTIFADVTLHPNNLSLLLNTSKDTLEPRDRWILYTFKGLTSAGRKYEWSRENDTPSENDLNRLAAKGYLKRSKNGATQITTEGKNVLCLKGFETVYHPKNKYYNTKE